VQRKVGDFFCRCFLRSRYNFIFPEKRDLSERFFLLSSKGHASVCCRLLDESNLLFSSKKQKKMKLCIALQSRSVSAGLHASKSFAPNSCLRAEEKCDGAKEIAQKALDAMRNRAKSATRKLLFRSFRFVSSLTGKTQQNSVFVNRAHNFYMCNFLHFFCISLGLWQETGRFNTT